MPKVIALVMCWAFILVAFRRDIKEARSMSRSIWIPFIWFAISASKPITYWIYPSGRVAWIERQPGYDLLQGNPLERNFLTVLICAGLIILYNRRHQFTFSLKDNYMLYLFYAYTLISILWSAYPDIAAKRWIRVVGDLTMVLVILTEVDPEEAVNRVLRRCSILLIPLSLLFVRYYRRIGVIHFIHSGSPMWVGVCSHKNALGLLCATMGVFLIWRQIKSWPKINAVDIILILMACYLLFGSKSSTSAVVFIIGTLVLLADFFIKGKSGSLNTILVVAIILLLIVQILSVTVLNQSLTSLFFSATARDSTFTGRTPLWQEMIRMGIQRPILGFGYASFWISEPSLRLREIFEWRPSTGHNGYLDIFMDLGLIGLAIVLLFLLRTYHFRGRSLTGTTDINKLLFIYFIMIVFHNFTESTLGKANAFLWVLLLLSSVVVTKTASAPEIEPSYHG